MKKCSNCKVYLSGGNFYKNTSRCKKCYGIVQLIRQKQHRTDRSPLWLQAIIKSTLRRRNLPLGSLIKRKELSLLLHEMLQTALVCPYTGDKLIPGVNLHLDHKIPISRQPELALDINNLQFVSKRYNHAKYDMTDKEFLTFCKLVIKRSKLQV